MTASKPKTVYEVYRSGELLGHYTLEEIRNQLRAGQLTPFDQVLRTSSNLMQDLAAFEEIFHSEALFTSTAALPKEKIAPQAQATTIASPSAEQSPQPSRVFFLRNQHGQVDGPFSYHEIKTLAQQGQLSRSLKVSRKGSPQWIKLKAFLTHRPPKRRAIPLDQAQHLNLRHLNELIYQQRLQKPRGTYKEIFLAGFFGAALALLSFHWLATPPTSPSHSAVKKTPRSSKNRQVIRKFLKTKLNKKVTFPKLWVPTQAYKACKSVCKVPLKTSQGYIIQAVFLKTAFNHRIKPGHWHRVEAVVRKHKGRYVIYIDSIQQHPP